MKNLQRGIALVCLLLLTLSIQGFAQYPEDILRLSLSTPGVGARSLGLGLAYTGVANDFSAIYWNPAGLGQLKMNEFSIGLSQFMFDNTGTLYGNGESSSNSSTNLNNLGLVYAVPTTRGSFVVALGYSKQADFTTGMSFKGFNPNSSIIQTWAPDGAPYSDLANNIAYQLYLANIDTVTGTWDSKIKDSLTQSGKVIEGGGLNNYSIGLGVEAAPNLFLGLSLNVVTGSYSYNRNYYEDDFRNIHNTIPFDLTSLSLLETVNSDISGFSAKFGFLYSYAPNSRIGVAIKTPTWVTVQETYTQEATSLFDNNDSFTYPSGGSSVGKDEYDATTPFVFSAGLSYAIRDLMLAAEVEYTDWTQMEFRNTTIPQLLRFNNQIKDEFRGTGNFHLGAEYELVPGAFQIRGGFAYLQSPYAGDPTDFDKKYITAGASFSLENAVIIELGYAHGMWKDYRVNYDQTSRVDEDITTNTIMGTVAYRF